MQSDYIFDTIDTHTAGEPTRFITGGVPCNELSGSVTEQRDQFSSEYDFIRELLLKEPRGHQDMFGAMVVNSDHPTADFGLFFMDNEGYLDMCGHGTIGAITMLLETGRLDQPDTSNPVVVETPAGLVETNPSIENNHVVDVTIQNVYSFYYDSVTVRTSELGEVAVDVVYAGNFFAMVDVTDIGHSIDRNSVVDLIDHALEIRSAVNEELTIHNPLTGEVGEVELTEFYQTIDGSDRNITVFGDGQVDRSPCGTGTCAKMALLFEKGELNVGETYTHESVVGTKFEGTITATEKENGFRMTVPTITGSAYITGKNTFLLSPDDPIKGFNLTQNGLDS